MTQDIQDVQNIQNDSANNAQCIIAIYLTLYKLNQTIT